MMQSTCNVGRTSSDKGSLIKSAVVQQPRYTTSSFSSPSFRAIAVPLKNETAVMPDKDALHSPFD